MGILKDSSKHTEPYASWVKPDDDVELEDEKQSAAIITEEDFEDGFFNPRSSKCQALRGRIRSIRDWERLTQ